MLVTWDVHDLRRSLRFWYFSGSAFCSLLTALCIAGWFYQEHVQGLLKEAIQALPDDEIVIVELDDMGELELVSPQSIHEQPEPVMPESVPYPSSANLRPVEGRDSARELRTSSSTEPLLTETERSESEITTATSSAEQSDIGQLRSRALRSTKTFPGGRDKSTY